ncbi:hypothetical protein EDD86DRAFT_214028 [Gorgonomyces haynaldii]|nr:hypothetical protein EDD86DRAFT_214028 [Gorgonomyces haynaldii]
MLAYNQQNHCYGQPVYITSGNAVAFGSDVFYDCVNHQCSNVFSANFGYNGLYCLPMSIAMSNIETFLDSIFPASYVYMVTGAGPNCTDLSLVSAKLEAYSADGRCIQSWSGSYTSMSMNALGTFNFTSWNNPYCTGVPTSSGVYPGQLGCQLNAGVYVKAREPTTSSTASLVTPTLSTLRSTSTLGTTSAVVHGKLPSHFLWILFLLVLF